MKLICISDTHGDHAQMQLPDGDVLLHAGDVTAHGSKADYADFLEWFAAQPHKHKVFIAGNHRAKVDEVKKPQWQRLGAFLLRTDFTAH